VGLEALGLSLYSLQVNPALSSSHSSRITPTKVSRRAAYQPCVKMLKKGQTGEIKSGVSNSNCSESQMRTYKVTRGPHYDADAITAVPEPY